MAQAVSTIRSQCSVRPSRSIVASLWREYLIDAAFPFGLAGAAAMVVFGVWQFATVSARLSAEGAPWWLVTAPLFLAGLAFVAGSRWLIVFALSYKYYRRLSRTRPKSKDFPCVSIMVPAYNEQENIAAAVESLLRLDYPDYEVLVVDDGSTDRTLKIAEAYQGRHGSCSVRVFHKPNGGKWSALNYAFQRSRAELLLCVDADSRLSTNALRVMVAHMTNPQIAAVAGQVCVRNRYKLLTRLQALEYILDNGALRMAQADSGTVCVVAGPLGLYRRTAFEELQLRFDDVSAGSEACPSGPFQPDTFAEDFDLSLSVLSLGGRIVYEPLAVSYTRAPDTSIALMNQRYRWCRGSLQVLRKYFQRGLKLPPGFDRRVLAWVTGTYLFHLLLQPVLFSTGVISLLLLLCRSESPLAVLGFLGMFQAINLFAGIMFVCMLRDSFLALLPLFVYDIYQGFFINFAWVISVIDEIRGGRMRWS